MRADIILFFIFLLCSAVDSFAWADGELLVWMSKDKGDRAMAELGNKFEKDQRVPVKVETYDNLTDKFQSVANNNKGPDILFWAHDRIGEWADAGFLRPIQIKDELRQNFIPMCLEAVTYNNQIWGYPIALETVSLIYNKKYVTGDPPTQLSQIPAYAAELRGKNPNVIPIMWDYNTPYFTWPFLASAGGYAFRKSASGYNPHDIGVNESGAVLGLQAILDLIHIGAIPRGSSYDLSEQKMVAGELAMMVNGPWAWANLERSGVDFGISSLPGVGGKPGRPFVGVLAALINHSSPNTDLAQQFIENYIDTPEGLKAIDAAVPIGVPALKSLLYEMTAGSSLIKTTYENAQDGVLMPNIPEMGKFWSAMAAALQIATNGQASPQAALDEAAKNMEQ
jgi:maltose/maltodextrin transport system substrate-binding protein